MVQKTCKILLAAYLALALFASSTNAQEFGVNQTFGHGNSRIFSKCGPQGCNPSPRRQGCGPQGCGPRQQPQPDQTSSPAPTQHPAVVATRSHFNQTTKHGWATAIAFNGKFYIVSCAHTWYANGEHHLLSNGNKFPVEFLGVSLADDLAILKCPAGLKSAMPLNQVTPPNGDALNLGYRRGVHTGYNGDDILVKGYVKEGDSGGPIHNAKGLVGIIATYTYQKGRLHDGVTSGPCATRIAAFIRSLTESPTSNDSAPSENIDKLLDRINKLEEALANLPKPVDGTDGKDGTDGTSSNSDCDNSNKNIAGNKKLIDSLDHRIKDIVLGVQRNNGTIEITQKAVLAQQKRIDAMEQKGRAAVLRIQRLEQTTSSHSAVIKNNTQTLKGKMQFRLRIDQSGRVIGVDPR